MAPPAPGHDRGGDTPIDPNPMPDIVLHDKHAWDRSARACRWSCTTRAIARAAAAGAQYRIAGKSWYAQVVAIKQGERYNRNKTLERHRDNALLSALLR
ncbi:hypothetical protein [Pseudomonas sp. SWI36]|uniref:hypothetical protein n=1 Tax=Pseudomonas sp. SWI36 TaxID=2083052 RepID=UPI002113CEEA|nr:hypothetical protein [Pseudomonas sp. SWI36]